jgi:protein-disulfide isomerase
MFKKSKNSKRFVTPLTLVCGFILLAGLACSKKAVSRPQFIFKSAPNKTLAAKVAGKEVTMDELFGGMRSEIYEAEMKVFELKMNKLRAMVLEKFMKADPNYKGMTNDAFLEKYIAKNLKATDKEIEAFAKERKIPDQQRNKQLNERIGQFLVVEKKKQAVDKWLTEKTKANPVEVYLTKPKPPVFDIKTEGAPYAGASDAKVTLVEFSDFQCPYCAKGATILNELKKKYGNKLKVVFKNFPLNFHKDAQGAAEAGRCVFEQDAKKFWKMHDGMFAQQSQLKKEDLKKLAGSLGVDQKKFDNCLDTGKYAATVKADLEDGKKVEVKSTPTFFVNGKPINGARPVAEFSEMIDAEFKK